MNRVARGLQVLFHPASIALVGVPRGLKPGKVFFLGLLDQGCGGPLYLVNQQAEAIDGYRAYRSILDISGPVDCSIVVSPRESAWDVLKECCGKKVSVVVFYTSGFSELGGEEGVNEEGRIRTLARSSGVRILGPNCVGVDSPASRLAPFPFMPKESGNLAFLSQSGSLMNLFINMCAERRLFFRHAVSCGNSCDVDLSELLAGMMADDDVRVAYACSEGMDPGKMRGVLAGSKGKKPVVMWKVGRPDAGRRSAASHAGSMGGDDVLWKSLFRQYGVTERPPISRRCSTQPWPFPFSR